MIILTKNNIDLFSPNNVNEFTLNENTCFFSSEDGNSRECTFIGIFKDLINLGYKIK